MTAVALVSVFLNGVLGATLYWGWKSWPEEQEPAGGDVPGGGIVQADDDGDYYVSEPIQPTCRRLGFRAPGTP